VLLLTVVVLSLAAVSGEDKDHSCPWTSWWSTRGVICDCIPCLWQRFLYHWCSDTCRRWQTCTLSTI